MTYFNYFILFIALIELVTVRIIGYPLEISPHLSKFLFVSGEVANWLGVFLVAFAFIASLLQMRRDERHIPLAFILLVWVILSAAVVCQIMPNLLIVKVILYSSSFLSIILLFNLGRREIERQSHIVCYLFAAPLLFRFLYFTLEAIQSGGFFSLPLEVYDYLRYVDEILMLIALLGVGGVVFDRISFPWNYKKTFLLCVMGLFVLFFTFSLLQWPWSTLAIVQEFGWRIFSKYPYLAIFFYGIPLLCGLSAILLLCVDTRSFSLGIGLLFILLGQSSMAHASLFYQILSFLGLLYILDEGAKKPRYVLGKRSSLFAS
ncbi:MAG: hypothetical protein A3F16_04125 [Deltaproteobacteria bacterium RIFCSPHIGHO2_12_FULL_43_9]|nr:MAG: hypothetical protein A3F16_04125 [Deltaproteobacteria bacterium RIFCSPHIGHO2_12_FULL_43_9]